MPSAYSSTGVLPQRKRKEGKSGCSLISFSSPGQSMQLTFLYEKICLIVHSDALGS